MGAGIRTRQSLPFANVQREYLEPDMWELSASDKKLVAGDIDDIDNSFFSVDEKSQIERCRKIGTIEYPKSDKTHSPDQIAFIDSRLKHLEDAANRLGRKDWITLAMGTLANIVVGVALAPEAVRELLRPQALSWAGLRVARACCSSHWMQVDT